MRVIMPRHTPPPGALLQDPEGGGLALGTIKAKAGPDLLPEYKKTILINIANNNQGQPKHLSPCSSELSNEEFFVS